MAIPLSVNGAVFEYPENFDETWGVNATGWAQAVTNGMLQRQGGNFPLTADVNFGPNFGLVSLYYKSRSANIATTGTLRLASADPGIAFRNNANSGDLVLTTNALDSLVWPSNLTIQNEHSLNLQDSGSVHTIAIQSPATTANYSLVLPPNAGSSGQVLRTDGSGTTTWVNAAGGGTVNSGTAGDLAYYATSSNAISDATFINFASNILTFNPGTGDSQFRITTPLGGNVAIIRLVGNGLMTQIASDQNGTFLLTDVDNSRDFLAYSRGGGGTVGFNTPITMASHKITGLTQGTTAGDAIAFPVAAAQISNNTITATQIANATITATQIANATITGTQIANTTITATQIANTTITAAQIANATITATQIASATITGTQIASNVALAGNPTTTTQSVNDSSTKIATTAFVNPQSSIVTSGYQELASGLIMQWGTIPSTGGGGTRVTISFPLAFPTAFFNLQVTAESTGGNGLSAWKIVAGSVSTSQFTLQNNDASVNLQGYWVALGH